MDIIIEVTQCVMCVYGCACVSLCICCMYDVGACYMLIRVSVQACAYVLSIYACDIYNL